MAKRLTNYLYIVLLCIGLFIVQTYYLAIKYPQVKQQIQENEQTIAEKEAELESLQHGLKLLPKTTETIANKQLELNALIERIPSYTSAATDLTSIMEVLELSGFSNINLQTGNVVHHEYENDYFIEREYTVVYTSPFSMSKRFVENLNQAYQVIYINRFITDNAPQLDSESEAAYRLLYGDEGFKELVETTLNFSLITMPSEDEEVQLLKSVPNSSTTFLHLETLFAEEILFVEQYNAVQELYPDSVLTIMMEELVTEEALKIITQSNGETNYTSAPLEGEVHITIQLGEATGEISVFDQSNNLLKSVGFDSVDYPNMYVHARWSKELEVLDSIHIKFENTTDQIITLHVLGDAAGKLHIYNELGEEVSKGGVKGKLIVK